MTSEQNLSDILSGIKAIGADVRNIREAQLRTESKVDTLQDATARMDENVKMAHKRINETHQHLNENVKPVLEDYKGAKNKLIGIAIGVGAGGGSLASWIIQVLTGNSAH